MPVAIDMPDDVIVLHDALEKLREYKKSPTPLTIHLKNCGTALRFLEVHLAKCYPGEPITLTGDDRLMERKGAPTSQTTSALILHGEDIPVAPDESPYITMSRKLKMSFSSGAAGLLEFDWSAAAFWYEYVAIHGGELLLEGLTRNTLQGDAQVASIYYKYFGVTTSYKQEGVKISKSSFPIQNDKPVSIDFERIPDLYPPIALTCERLGIKLQATGTSRLRFKESNRLQAVRLHEVRNDHRMAMALLAADFIKLNTLTPEKQNELQTIIAKSYPGFIEQYNRISTESRRSTDGQPTVKAKVTATSIAPITPIKGVNDDNLGKKHALSKLIHAATTDYVWLHDDDVQAPPVLQRSGLLEPRSYKGTVIPQGDLWILPLRMVSCNENPTLLEQLQIAEYAAIQELTMRTAKRGKPVMCSGANLIVKREVWLECEPELHPEIPSGDDMFLLEAVKRHGYKVGVIDEPDYTAVVRPLTLWRAFFRQRMRWAGKAPHYTDRDIRRCGAFIVAANILQILCPLIILVKFPIEYSLIRQREASIHSAPYTINHNKTTWYVALLLEIVYPFYLLASLIGGLFRQREW